MGSTSVRGNRKPGHSILESVRANSHYRCCELVATPTITDLVLVIDALFSMMSQVVNTCWSVCYHITRNCMDTRHPNNQCKCQVHAFVTSCINYGNAMLFSILDCLLHSGRRHESSSRSDEVTNNRCPRYWGILWKSTLNATYWSLYTAGFTEAHRWCTLLLHHRMPHHSLCSADDLLLHVPRVNLKQYGHQWFVYAGPILWNATLWNTGNSSQFKKTLDMFIFKLTLCFIQHSVYI